MEKFLRQRCAEPVAVSYQSDATSEVTVETWDSVLQGPAFFGEDVDRRVSSRALIRIQHEGWSNSFVRLPCTSHR